MKSKHRDSQGGPTRPGRGSDPLGKFLDKNDLDGLLYHCRLARFLAAAGFDILRIEREDNHADVWVAHMRSGFVPRGQEVETAQAYIQTFLRRQGVRYPKREITVMVVGNRVTAAFNWKSGKPGMLIYWGGTLKVTCKAKR